MCDNKEKKYLNSMKLNEIIFHILTISFALALIIILFSYTITKIRKKNQPPVNRISRTPPIITPKTHIILPRKIKVVKQYDFKKEMESHQIKTRRYKIINEEIHKR